MRHRVAGKKLSRDYDHRRALRRNLMIALIQNGKIKTTEAKADLIRAEIEKLVTKAKQGLAHPDPARGVHARRIVLARLGDWPRAVEAAQMERPVVRQRRFSPPPAIAPATCRTRR